MTVDKFLVILEEFYEENKKEFEKATSEKDKYYFKGVAETAGGLLKFIKMNGGLSNE